MELLLDLNIGIKHGYSVIHALTIAMALYFVAVSHSTGGWTSSLIFVFHGQSIYKSDKQISCRKMEWL